MWRMTMTDAGDVLAFLTPAAISVVVVVGIAVISSRRRKP
jgi:hypothetical protein